MVSTTVNANGTLPQATITVVSTTGFTTSGTIFITNANGTQTVTYTGTTSTTFTGCSGGTGAITASTTGVFQPVEQGTTVNITMAPKISPALQLGLPTQSHGKYNFFANNTFGPTDLANSYSFPFYQTLPKITSSTTTSFYKMVGFYVTGSVYEEFVVTGSPASSTTVNPNTGHTLINCYVSTFWQQ